MPIDNTKCVEDVRGRSADDQVNEYLKLGWVLLNIYTEDLGEPGAPSAVPHYILGWQDANKAPEYPESVIKAKKSWGAFTGSGPQ